MSVVERSGPNCNILTDVLSARVPPGFSDQIRAAARAEGVKPGTLIRAAIAERIARAACSTDPAMAR